MGKTHRVQYHGEIVRRVNEIQLFRLPRKKIDIADYQVVDMDRVMVSGVSDEAPADLLLAHPNHPVRLGGLVHSQQKQFLLEFPIITGFSVEDGEDGLDGDCKIFALGNARWYRLRSPVEAYSAMFQHMNRGARIYWILRDKRGDWLNSVDMAMQQTNPHLRDDSSAAYIAAAEKIAMERDYEDTLNYGDYWEAVHTRLCPDESPSRDAGFAMSAEHARYLLHHMIVDHTSYFWKSSLLFAQLRGANKEAALAVMETHGIARLSDTSTSYAHPPNVTQTMTSSLNERLAPMTEVQSSLSMSETSNTRLGSIPVEPRSSADSLPRKRKRESSQTSSEVDKPTRKKKRELSAVAHDNGEPEEVQYRTTSWNTLEQAPSPHDAERATLPLATAINKIVGHVVENQDPTMPLQGADDELVSSSQPSRGQISTVQSGSNSGFTRSRANLKSTAAVSRISDYSNRSNPFSQVTGTHTKQADIFVETLQSMLYEEDITDLNMADVFFVWQRDYNEGSEKVIALLSFFVQDILASLSAGDTSESTSRHQSASVENVWRSTTLYDQLYKVYKINDQDSDLWTLIDWHNVNMFHKLCQVEGIWRIKEGQALAEPLSRVSSKHDIAQVSDSEDGTSEQSISIYQKQWTKKRPSLRPAAKAAESEYFRNGAGPKAPRLTTTGLQSSSSTEHVRDMNGSLTSIIVIADDEEASDCGTTVEGTESATTEASESSGPPLVMLRNTDDTVAKPAPKPYAFSPFVTKRGLDTSPNNAGIWRCRIPNCWFFRDNAASSEGQDEIVSHYNWHAETMLDRVAILGEASLPGVSTSALSRKLEREATVWREAMNGDAWVVR